MTLNLMFVVFVCMTLFFFFKQKTAYEMRISDWSSDVCSSDLTIRALDIAIENRLPVVHLCDSAGGFLPLQADLFADKYYAGRIFRNQCMLSKMGVQQVSVVLGHCTAGGAYVPGLSDYNVIVRGTGAIFLAGPPQIGRAHV